MLRETFYDLIVKTLLRPSMNEKDKENKLLIIDVRDHLPKKIQKSYRDINCWRRFHFFSIDIPWWNSCYRQYLQYNHPWNHYGYYTPLITRRGKIDSINILIIIQGEALFVEAFPSPCPTRVALFPCPMAKPIVPYDFSISIHIKANKPTDVNKTHKK